jgi:hypothetical protein
MLTSSAADLQEVPLPPWRAGQVGVEGDGGAGVGGGGWRAERWCSRGSAMFFFYYYPIGRYQCDTTEFLLS